MSVLHDLRSRFARWRRERRTIEELNMLSDRDLADLGIGRSDIRSLAREASAASPVDLHEWRERRAPARQAHAKAA